MKANLHLGIVEFCGQLLARHDDTPAGMGWTWSDADTRYRVMLDVIRSGFERASLLDFGCGAAHLLEYIGRTELSGIDYHGLDVSPQAIALCRRKFPEVDFIALDVLARGAQWPDFDYVAMNGILTYKGELAHTDMFDYSRTLLRTVFEHVKIGLAFNVMSKQVDWEREDLFHLPIDPLVDFISHELSRHIVVRADYGLYEYTVYVYREPMPGATSANPAVDRPAR